MSYLLRRVLAKPRLILDEMCSLYGKFASYLRRLIFPRINGPIVSLNRETEIRGIIIILLLISFFRRDVNTEKFGLG